MPRSHVVIIDLKKNHPQAQTEFDAPLEMDDELQFSPPVDFITQAPKKIRVSIAQFRNRARSSLVSSLSLS